MWNIKNTKQFVFFEDIFEHLDNVIINDDFSISLCISSLF